MTSILILGGSGMLGHKLYQVLSNFYSTYVTFRNYNEKLKSLGIYQDSHIFNGIDAFDINSIRDTIDIVKPNVVLNCIGVIKQLPAAMNSTKSIYLNSLFPHLLTEICEKKASKLIHVSTDCVFSGKRGNYSEKDMSDAEDLYGKTKYLGEVSGINSLTIRTSIIGHELFSNISLVDWFLSKDKKKIKGFTNAIYSGFPTVTFANELVRIINDFPDLYGLYNLSTEKISKYKLLQIIKKVYNLNIEIKPYYDFNCDRSLNSSAYKNITGFIPKKWEIMIEEMYKDYLDNKNRGIYNV